ncbi:MAG: hypothetical protein ACRDFZ_05895 [Candidatus Limnocylindria bacterium]
MDIRGLFSGSARREQDLAKRLQLASDLYTRGEIDAMTPEELDIAVQSIGSGTCLCGDSALFIDGVVCPGCLTNLSRAIQGGLALGDSSIQPKTNIAVRRMGLPGKAKQKLRERLVDLRARR